MGERARAAINPYRDEGRLLALLPPRPDDVLAFHRSLPGYAPTPLVALPALARALGVGGLWIKDEGRRFGLGAFKALGASWAIHRWMASRRAGGPVTFTTATDGNHGRAVAWTARALGQRAVIFVNTEGATDPEGYRRIVGSEPC